MKRIWEKLMRYGFFPEFYFRRAYRNALSRKDQEEIRHLTSLRKDIFTPGDRIMRTFRFDEDLRLRVNLSELEGGNLYFGVEFEPLELSLVKALVRPGNVFLDVGAHIGIYSLMASRLVGSQGSVHAFEPADSTYATLVSNLELNGVRNVKVNHLALGEKPGKVKLLINRESGLSSMGNTGRGQVIETEEVPCTTVDGYVRQNGIQQVDFLKIDVEGYEGHVLRGAVDLLKRSRKLVIMCELAQKNYEPLGFSINAVLEWIRGLGYDAWEIGQETSRLIKIERTSPSYENQNFIFAWPGVMPKNPFIDLDGH